MDQITDAIWSLRLMSEALETAACDEKNYNTNYGYYLEQLSHEMYKMSNELKEISYMAGGL
jgi:hypothetical protein